MVYFVLLEIIPKDMTFFKKLCNKARIVSFNRQNPPIQQNHHIFSNDVTILKPFKIYDVLSLFEIVNRMTGCVNSSDLCCAVQKDKIGRGVLSEWVT